MSREEHKNAAVLAPVPPARTHGPHWRALLEARWLVRLQEVTELSLAYHTVAAPCGGDGTGKPGVQALLRRTVAARRKLADIEEALGRLAAGNFGSCEQCGSAIPAGLLAVLPEARYCPPCDACPPCDPWPPCDARPVPDHAPAGRSLP